MRIDPLGESAAILRDLPLPAAQIAAGLAGVPGVVEAWAAFDTVGVTMDRSVELGAVVFEPCPSVGRLHEVPVLYDGEDLPEVANRLGLTLNDVVDLHARTYDCRAVGFCPGFAYLGPLPPALDLPRRESPRTRVAPGSVAIAAGMTAVYPLERPGGWWLIGRTPLSLVDEATDYFPIRAGDRVRFTPIGAAEFEARRGERLSVNGALSLTEAETPRDRTRPGENPLRGA